MPLVMELHLSRRSRTSFMNNGIRNGILRSVKAVDLPSIKHFVSIFPNRTLCRQIAPTSVEILDEKLWVSARTWLVFGKINLYSKESRCAVHISDEGQAQPGRRAGRNP